MCARSLDCPRLTPFVMVFTSLSRALPAGPADPGEFMFPAPDPEPVGDLINSLSPNTLAA